MAVRGGRQQKEPPCRHRFFHTPERADEELQPFFRQTVLFYYKPNF